MAFAGKIWRLLVGIKDGLVLVFMVLFFVALFSILSARPNPGLVTDGALMLNLDGVIVEEKSQVDPFDALLSQQAPLKEYRSRDLVRAIDAAAGDDRINAIALDLTEFFGGGDVHLTEVGEALERFRKAEKPILSFAIAYTDDGMRLAAHASEVWVDPLGGAVIAGPGGNRLYYGELLDRLNINARVYKVGRYKSAVEPFSRGDMSDDARENYTQLYGALWEEWQAQVSKARPSIDLEIATGAPAEWVASANGDLATAALSAKLVDKLGSRVEFGEAVAAIAGENALDDAPGAFAMTELDPWLADVGGTGFGNIDGSDNAIGVITVAGEIVDGEAGPGTAGGERIAKLLDDALDKDFKALVVRVDSPGGSVLASEQIRLAILRHKAKDIPIAVSMANLAASGGYWVSTPADRIFAEPQTITGSIGIFAVIPTFEQAAAQYGINSDGVRTTPLSGQPDLIAGFTPEVDAILQSSIENGYDDFLTRVSEARRLTKAQVDDIGQGRVWDGGTARQIGLVDQYGGLQDALSWAAAQAGLEEGDWTANFLEDEADPYDALIRSMLTGDAESAPQGDLFATISRRETALGGQMLADLDRLLGTRGMQAYCLECPVSPVTAVRRQADGWMARLARFLAD